MEPLSTTAEAHTIWEPLFWPIEGKHRTIAFMKTNAAVSCRTHPAQHPRPRVRPFRRRPDSSCIRSLPVFSSPGKSTKDSEKTRTRTAWQGCRSSSVPVLSDVMRVGHQSRSRQLASTADKPEEEMFVGSRPHNGASFVGFSFFRSRRMRSERKSPFSTRLPLISEKREIAPRGDRMDPWLGHRYHGDSSNSPGTISNS